MASDRSGTMNWANCRQRNNPRTEAYYGISFDRPGLHKNCCDCRHIRADNCLYVKHPKQRKWPCIFKEMV